MCGIAGILNTSPPPIEADLLRMRDVMEYRGPDGFGSLILEADGVALGHRRLSILDPTPAGAQPMVNAAGNAFIVFNGEVFNYLEIRSELEQNGDRFHTGTDTEVILAAYSRWGTDCLARFIGMFAFAIWDAEKKLLFAARDRMGVKPFYFMKDRGRFLFASEPKAILTQFSRRPDVALPLIDSYMSFGYIPGNLTLHEGLQRLLPGHFLIYDGKEIRTARYWDVSFENSADLGLRHYTDQFSDLFYDSIRIRLRSDVPLGVYLSGGLDSSSVVASLAPRLSKKLKTYSVAYDLGPEFNETSYARLVAKKFETDHHELIISPKDFVDFIPSFICHMDEPVTESAAISLYYLSKEAKKQVTVMLSGEGADELFAGYDFYVYNAIIERLRGALSGQLTGATARLAAALMPEGKIKKYLNLASQPLWERYKGISTYDESLKQDLYSPEFIRIISNGNQEAAFLRNQFEKTSSCDSLSRMLYFDIKTWLVDDLLIKADRMSMAASIELRVPFLDHRLVEFAASMPSRYKINGRTTKYLLKHAMRGKLPDEIIDRKKMGFPTPLEIMFRKDLYDYAVDTLLGTTARIIQYFRRDRIQKALEDHRTGRKDNHRLIWQLVVLEEWHRKFA
jgi:asparagine synthase (glutamine-hydrolysing)